MRSARFLFMLLIVLPLCIYSQNWSNNILSFYPADNAIRIAEDDSLVINFQNQVEVLKGNLTIYNEEGLVIESISLQSDKVKGLNSKIISIHPDSIFRHQNSYYVQIDTGAFGSGFQGLKGNLTWNFSSYNVLKEIIPSKAMGDKYKLFIGYPENYNPNRVTPYPVVYLPDGNWIEDFSDAETHGILGMMYSWMRAGTIPDLIFVGIGYPNTQTPVLQRQRDFLFDKKADKYFSFIKNELMPYVDEEYHCDTNDRTLMGYSFGGVFSFFTLMQYHSDSNRIFKNIMAGDPSLWYPGTTSTCFNLEQAYKLKSDSMPVNFFMATGNPENSNALFVSAMNDTLNDRNYKGLQNKFMSFPYADHLACNFPAYEEALYWFFNKEKTTVVFPTYPRDTLTLASAAFNLKNMVEPKGGTFTGKVLKDSIFDPRNAGIGEHLVSYHYTDINSVVVTRNYLFKVFPYAISSSIDFIYKTDSIDTFVGTLSLPDASDTLSVSYSLAKVENLYTDLNDYFTIENGNVYLSKALPSNTYGTMQLGIQAITELKDTFALAIQWIVKNNIISITDKQVLNKTSSAGTYLGKITISSDRDRFSFSLPDTGTISFDNRYFTIQHDSLFLKQDLSPVSKLGLTVNVMVYQKDGCPVYQKFNFSLSSTLQESTMNIDVFPNPANNYIFINGSKSNTVITQITMCDVSGKQILSEKCRENTSMINVENVDSGLYLLYIETEEGRVIQKIVIN